MVPIVRLWVSGQERIAAPPPVIRKRVGEEDALAAQESCPNHTAYCAAFTTGALPLAWVDDIREKDEQALWGEAGHQALAQPGVTLRALLHKRR